MIFFKEDVNKTVNKNRKKPAGKISGRFYFNKECSH